MNAPRTPGLNWTSHSAIRAYRCRNVRIQTVNASLNAAHAQLLGGNFWIFCKMVHSENFAPSIALQDSGSGVSWPVLCA
jgi:hypothetical protein